jgi:hypothetical protein
MRIVMALPARGSIRIEWIIAAATLLVHLAFAGRYDIFRNELYFIVCGRHPAFGYVDQPPIVPLLAAATQIFGDNIWLLRLPAVLAAAALVPLTASFARLLGGGAAAVALAATAAAVAPLLAGLTTTLGTSSFEPLAWTGIAYLVMRAVLLGDRRSLLWAGIAAGLAFETKYGVAIWLIGLGVGIVATDSRRILRMKELWFGLAAMALIAAPSFLWQIFHSWPFLEVIGRARVGANLTGSPIGFAINQIMIINPFLAPLWIAGILAPWFRASLRPARCLSITFILAAVIVVATHGKDYYLAGAYPAMFAVGAVACEGLARWLRGIWLALVLASAAAVAPLVLPILDPPVLARYMAATHLAPRPEEVAAIGAPLTQIFSDELGWRRMEKQVAAVYASLSPEERANAAIMTLDYGEAAAIDVYGPEDGLPTAISGDKQYFLWGPGAADGRLIIRLNGDPARWQTLCEKSEVAGLFGAPYVMPYENDRPIILCRGFRPGLSAVWDRFKRY